MLHKPDQNCYAATVGDRNSTIAPVPAKQFFNISFAIVEDNDRL